MFWIFPLAILILFELIADVSAKEWSLRAHSLLWVVALGSYFIGNIFWLFALREGSGLARGAIIFSVATAVIASVIGIYFYNESLNKIQAVGIMLGVISLVLIFWDGV